MGNRQNDRRDWGKDNWDQDLDLIIKSEESVLLPASFTDLLTVDSLTLGLKALSPCFAVELIQLGRSKAKWDESTIFLDDSLFSREVYLTLNNIRVIHARTICHVNSVHWLEILDCGESSLGYRLFDGSLPISRSPFEYAYLPLKWNDKISEEEESGRAIARRSSFYWNGESLSIMEQYLPALEKFI